MRTTVELPDDLFRKAKASAALQGRALKDLVADGLTLLLNTPNGASSRPASKQVAAAAQSLKQKTEAPSLPVRRRGSAGAWARRFAGVASLAPGETIDDARLDHYRKKYGA